VPAGNPPWAGAPAAALSGYRGLCLRCAIRGASGRVRRRFHRPHLLERLRDLLGADDILVRADMARQLVGYGLLQIGRISSRSGSAASRVSAPSGRRRAPHTFGFDLPRIAVQADAIDRAHGQTPSLRLFC